MKGIEGLSLDAAKGEVVEILHNFKRRYCEVRAAELLSAGDQMSACQSVLYANILFEKKTIAVSNRLTAQCIDRLQGESPPCASSWYLKEKKSTDTVS
jgi:hypothetical protein